MRYKLKNLHHSPDALDFEAVVAGFGKQKQKPRRAVMLLTDVKRDGETICDHVWVTATPEFEDLQRLDRIRFTAIVSIYNHRLHDPAARRALGKDYKLEHLREVTVIARNLREWRKSFARSIDAKNF